MVKKQYFKAKDMIERRRFRLLLVATLLLLILPTFFGKGLLSLILFVTCLSFLLIQSMIISNASKPDKAWIRYLIVATILFLYWLEPLGFKSYWIDISKFFLLVIAFITVTFYLLKFLRRAKDVNLDVIFVAVNIYLLLGIVFGSLAFLLNEMIQGSYNLPDNITEPNFMTFIYYSFITMSTVGYGDITPRLPQTQTLAYLVAVTGQLYVAIIVAFLVGKLLMKPDKDQ
jgi:voltage-gated potassium channel